MKSLPKWINLLAGIILFTANIIPFANPEWFFHQAYQIELTTPQSYTVLRTLSIVLAVMGFIWIWIALRTTQHIQLLKATFVLISAFVLGRVVGLLVDGWDQYLTYYELGFEFLCWLVVLAVLFKNRNSTE
ncbi:MAG: DUF4345 family protein [Flavobacteriaceae bacterium]|nr:DUF4345 family protein [Flavobacteriaceae bacterium]